MIRPVRSSDEAIAVLRDRAREIGATRRDIDFTAGLADGYASKVLSREPLRNIVTETFFAIAAALGFRVVLEEDAAALGLVREHCTRQRPVGCNQFEKDDLERREAALANERRALDDQKDRLRRISASV